MPSFRPIGWPDVVTAPLSCNPPVRVLSATAAVLLLTPGVVTTVPTVSNDLTSGTSLSATLDELRVSTRVFSSSWIATEYNNQSSPGTFYTFGAENANAVLVTRRRRRSPIRRHSSSRPSCSALAIKT